MAGRPKWVTEWERALLSVRSNALGPVALSSAAGDVLTAAYADMLLQIEAIITRRGADLGPLMAETMARRLRSILAQNEGLFSAEIENRVNRLIESISEDHERAARAAFGSANIQGAFAADFSAVPRRALEGMAKRAVGEGISSNFRSLIATQWGHTFAEVDRFLIAQVGLGTGAELAKRRLAFMLASDATGNIDPALLRALQTRGVAGRRFANILARAARDPTLMGFSSRNQAVAALSQARGLLWKSRRIAVSEINTAHSEAHREGAIASPVVDLMKWNVSGRHRGLPSSPDVCDTLATRDVYSLGAGIYYAENYPYRPHPNCGCFQSFVLRPIDEWASPKRTPTRPRRITPAEIMNDYGERIGKERAKNLAARLNAQVKASDDAYRLGRGPGPKPGPKPKPGPGPKPAPTLDPTTLPAPGIAPQAERFAHNPLRDATSGKWVSGAEAHRRLEEEIGKIATVLRAKIDEATKAVEATAKKLDDLTFKYAQASRRLSDIEFDIHQSIPREATHNGPYLKPDYEDILHAEYRKNEAWLIARKELDAARAARDGAYSLLKDHRGIALAAETELRARQSDRVLAWLQNEADEAPKLKVKVLDDEETFRAYKLKSKKKPSEAILAQYQQGVDAFSRFVDPEIMRGIGTDEINFLNRLTDRAYHIGTKRGGNPFSIIVGDGKDVIETTVHEMGHMLEYLNPTYFKKIEAYLLERTRGKITRRVRDMTKSSSYATREIAFDMGKESAHHPYMWKKYSASGGQGFRASEITSMMIQYMFASPDLAIIDRELFIYVYELIKGIR